MRAARSGLKVTTIPPSPGGLCLWGKKEKPASLAGRADGLTMIGGGKSVRCVFENLQVVASRDFVDAVEVTRMPGIMHGHDDPRIRRNLALQIGRVHR